MDNKNLTTHVFINQAGYSPEAAKRAVLSVPAKSFQLVAEDGTVCFSGSTALFGLDRDSQDEVSTADFTAYQKPGKYRICLENGECSHLFEIGTDCYNKVFYDINRAFYYLRCGCGLDEKHAGKFAHGSCHTAPAVLWEDETVSLEVSGGWHDAGDYGRYVTAGACALAHLLYTYRLYPEVLKKWNFDLPDHLPGTPDILTECRHELEWMLKMQREDGGVYHKVTTKRHAPFVMPEEDTEQLYVFPVFTSATADFAAVMAMASTLYREFDAAFADLMLAAAKRAHEWLEQNPEFIPFHNPEGCNTGEYGEAEDRDNRFWASVELFAATGEEAYHDALKKALKFPFSRTALGYADVGGFGAFSYVLYQGGAKKDAEIERMLREELMEEGKRLKEASDRCGYGAAMETADYVWGSNMVLLKYAMNFIIADYCSGKNEYRDYVVRQLDYLLGVNATGYSYVTGNGELCCENPHLRPTFADGVEECIPGMVSGGPNRRPADEDARRLVPAGTPPMKCYADHVGCYSLNEITIYWNSPAVFALAYLLQ